MEIAQIPSGRDGNFSEHSSDWINIHRGSFRIEEGEENEMLANTHSDEQRSFTQAEKKG